MKAKINDHMINIDVASNAAVLLEVSAKLDLVLHLLTKDLPEEDKDKIEKKKYQFYASKIVSMRENFDSLTKEEKTEQINQLAEQLIERQQTMQ